MKGVFKSMVNCTYHFQNPIRDAIHFFFHLKKKTCRKKPNY